MRYLQITWVLNNTPFTDIPKDAYGFVYQITDSSGKKYIGKKLFYFKKTIQKNKKKKRVTVESDWKEYYGSSPTLLEDIQLNGKENYTREILHIVGSKSEANYLEAKEQFLRDVLLDDNYYNEWVSCRITSRHLQNSKLRKEYGTKYCENTKEI